LDLKIEPARLKRKNINAAIAADVKLQQIKTDNVFDTHRGTFSKIWLEAPAHRGFFSLSADERGGPNTADAQRAKEAPKCPDPPWEATGRDLS
jgi:hypothetical protein